MHAGFYGWSAAAAAAAATATTTATATAANFHTIYSKRGEWPRDPH